MPYDFTHKKNNPSPPRKPQMNKKAKNRVRPMNTKNKLMVVQRAGWRERAKQVKGSGRHRFPVMEQMHHGKKRHSTRNPGKHTVTVVRGHGSSTCGEQSMAYRVVQSPAVHLKLMSQCMSTQLKTKPKQKLQTRKNANILA